MPGGNQMIVQGDAEAAIVAILSADAGLLALVPSTNISTELTTYKAFLPWVEVVMQGGDYTFPVFWKPRVDIYAYGATRAKALDIAQLCMAILFREMGKSTVYFGTKILNVQTELGPTRVPDKPTEAPRYVMSFRLTCAP